jgi:cytosine/uracil/thiamine/allantoin permease
VLPRVVNWLVFPPDRFAPLATLFALALALAAAIATRARRFTWAAGLAAASLVSAVATAMLGVGEFARFGVQEAIGLRVAILLLVVLVLDAVLNRRAVGSSTPSSPAKEWENVDADRSARGGVPSQE